MSAVRRFGATCETLRRPPDRFEVAVIEVAEFAAVVEQDAVPLPVETVGEDHSALGPGGHVASTALVDEVRGRTDPVAEFQVELTIVGLAQRVGLPKLHGLILPERRASAHVLLASHRSRAPGRRDGRVVVL